MIKLLVVKGHVLNGFFVLDTTLKQLVCHVTATTEREEREMDIFKNSTAGAR